MSQFAMVLAAILSSALSFGFIAPAQAATVTYRAASTEIAAENGYDLAPMVFRFRNLASPAPGLSHLTFRGFFRDMDLNGADEFFTVKINGVTTGAVTQLRNLKIADPYDSRGAFTFTINTSDIGGFSGQDLIIRLRPSAEMGYYAPDSPLNAVLGPFETGRVALKLSYDTIPLPAGLVLLGSGLGALALRKNRKAKAAD